MSYTITWSRCPHCGRTIRISKELGSPSLSIMGEPKITLCQYCGLKVSDGKKEWPDMSQAEKTFQVFVFVLQSIFTGVLLGGIGSFFIFGILFKMIDSNFTSVLVICSIGILLSMSICVHVNIRSVKESINRHNRKREE